MEDDFLIECIENEIESSNFDFKRDIYDFDIEPNIIIDFKVIDYDGNKFGIFKIGSESNDKPYLLSKQYGKLQKGYTRIRKGQKNEYVSRRDFDIFYKEKNHDEYSSINLKGIINRNISDTFEIKKFENPVD